MSNSGFEPPFEKIFVAVVGDSKRPYTTQGPARSRITTDVSRQTESFKHNCSLWEVDDDGWRLIFKANAGEHSSLIPWNNIAKTWRDADALEDQRRKAYTDARDREEYERLKSKFGE